MLSFLVFVLAVLCAIIFALYMSLFSLVSIDVTVICIAQRVFMQNPEEK